jgi:hypothetical protein
MRVCGVLTRKSEIDAPMCCPPMIRMAAGLYGTSLRYAAFPEDAIALGRDVEVLDTFRSAED